jgi:aminopeptidase-like protein
VDGLAEGLVTGAALHAHRAALRGILRDPAAGPREALGYVAAQLPLTLRELPAGTPVLDWTVPPEWRLRDAAIRGAEGAVIADLAAGTLRVAPGSAAVEALLPREELQRHLDGCAAVPDHVPLPAPAAPGDWRLGLPHRLRVGLSAPAFRVRIEAAPVCPALVHGECVLPGLRDKEEVLVCIPFADLPQDEPAVADLALGIELARGLAGRRRRFTWRFLFPASPAGAVAWIAANREGAARRIRYALVLKGLGGGGPLAWRRTRRGAAIDRIAALVLGQADPAHRLANFAPWQGEAWHLAAPGLDLPIGCLEGMAGGPEAAWEERLALLEAMAEAIEHGGLRPVPMVAHCMPDLTRRGLAASPTLARVLALADGTTSLLDMAERAGRPFAEIRAAAAAAAGAGLLEGLDPASC